MNKIDITHTTKPADRPHPDAKLIRDLDTGVAAWEGVPEPEVPPFANPALTGAATEYLEAQAAAEPEPEPEVLHAPHKAKKLHGKA